MKNLAALFAVFAVAVSAETPQAVVMKNGAEIMAAIIEKGKQKTNPNAPTNVSLTVRDGYRISFVRRELPGVPLVHTGDGKASELHYILDGSLIFVTGGTIVKTTGGAGVQGLAIEGGVTHHLTKGDVIFVPDGVAHWYKEITSPVTYLEVRFEK